MLECIYKIRLAIAEKNRLYIDFSKTEELNPCGTILLIAAIETALTNGVDVIASYPKSDAAEQMLQHINILQRLGLEGRKVVDNKMVTRWAYHTDIEASFDDNSFENIANLIIEWTNADENEVPLLTGISEAVTNIQHHAYKEETPRKTWWLFLCREDDTLMLAVCDLGKGIPKTLPKTIRERLGSEAENTLKRLHIFDITKTDSRMIQAALAYGRTRTEHEHRGKGLAQMQSVAMENAEGFFAVHSRRGTLVYMKSEERERLLNYRDPVPGTIVLWKIRLPSEGIRK
ncbi:MAG TPA: hypothetical protein DF427_06795 [Moraxellaceae bacterium]|nr:hypothetical protein [Moraxellaceae bacterium]